MKECCLIQDSMPLYIDGICSDETKEYIAEHLQSCEECKKVYEDMRMPPVPDPAAELVQKHLDEVEPLKKIRKNHKMKNGILLSLLSLLLLLSIVFFCWHKSFGAGGRIYCNCDSYEILTVVADYFAEKGCLEDLDFVIINSDGGFTGKSDGFVLEPHGEFKLILLDENRNCQYKVTGSPVSDSAQKNRMTRMKIEKEPYSATKCAKINFESLLAGIGEVSKKEGEEVTASPVTLGKPRKFGSGGYDYMFEGCDYIYEMKNGRLDTSSDVLEAVMGLEPVCEIIFFYRPEGEKGEFEQYDIIFVEEE